MPTALTVRTAAWYRKEEVTFADALACVRDRLWKGFSLSGSGPEHQKNPKDLLNHFAELLRFAQ